MPPSLVQMFSGRNVMTGLLLEIMLFVRLL